MRATGRNRRFKQAALLEALREGREEYRLLVETCPDGIFLEDLQGRFLDCNGAACRLFGYSKEEMLTFSIQDLVPEKIAHSLPATFDKDSGGFFFEWTGRRKDGSLFPTEVASQFCQINNQHRLIAYVRDITERKRMEEDLRLAQMQWAQFLEASPDPMWIKDQSERYVAVNNAFLQAASRSREQVIGKGYQELFPPERAARYRAEDREVLEKGEAEFEETNRDTGQEKHYLIKKVRMVSPQGKVLGVLCLSNDLTSRKQAEEALRSSNEQLLHHQRALLELSSQPFEDPTQALSRVLETDALTLHVERVSYWSMRPDHSAIVCEDLFELSCSRHSRGTVLQAADYPAYFQGLTRDRALIADDARSDPLTREFTNSYFIPLDITALIDVPVRRQGRIVGIVCHEHIGKVRRWTVEEEDFAGSIADMVALILETAERRRVEEALISSEERLRLALEGASEGLWDWNIPTGQAYFSPGYYTMLGYEPGEFPPNYESFERLLHPEDLAPTRQALEDYLASHQEGYEIEFRALTKTGEVRWILTRGKVVSRDEEGRPVRMVGTHTDITERKRADAEIQKVRVDLLFAVSHELKTPLMTMLQTQEILRELPPAERAQCFAEYDQVWQRNLLRLRRMIDNLVDSQRSSETRVPLTLASCKLQELVQQTLQDLAAYAQALQVQVDCRAVENLLPLQLDAEVIQRVVDNLLANAIKFSARGGTVQVSLLQEGSWALLTIADCGSGIAKKEQERLFQPFQRARQADRMVVPGTGLGLYVSRRMVEAHGGTLDLESEEGKGTRVTVRLSAG